jgi:DNA primase
LIVVEGSLDAIRIDQHKIGPVVAILGAKISGRQAEILASLRPKRVFSMFDRDTAGVGATFSLRESVRSCPMFVCRYPKGLNDPAELSRKEAQHVIQKAVPFSHFNARAMQAMKGA